MMQGLLTSGSPVAADLGIRVHKGREKDARLDGLNTFANLVKRKAYLLGGLFSLIPVEDMVVRDATLRVVGSTDNLSRILKRN